MHIKTLNNIKLLNEITTSKVKVYPYATITLSNGTMLKITPEKDLLIDGNNHSISLGNGFPLGVAVCKTISLHIDNHDDRFSEYDFTNATIQLYSILESVKGSNVISETVYEGKFTVIDSVSPGSVLDITAYDDMYKADVPFISGTGKKAYPITLLEEICNRCNIKLSKEFKNYITQNFSGEDTMSHITNVPIDCTARDFIGYLAQICGGNAFIKNDELTLQKFSLDTQKRFNVISGGYVEDNLTEDNSIAGGIITDNATNQINAPNISDTVSYHIVHSFIDEPEIATEEIIVTGIATVKANDDDSTDNLVVYGTQEYALVIDNPLYYGEEKALVTHIGKQIVGIKARAFSGAFSPNPLIEFGDYCILVDRKGRNYNSIITEHTFNYLGNSELGNSVESAEKNKTSYSGGAKRLIQETRKREIANQVNFEKIQEQFDNASGMFFTKILQEDNSYKYYLHDKNKKEDSDIVIEMSNAGLVTYIDNERTIAVTVDGTAILNQIIADGLTADMIKGATIKVGDMDNKAGILEVYGTQGTLVGTIDSDGITSSSLYLQSPSEPADNLISKIHMETNTVMSEITLDSETRRLSVKIPDTFGIYRDSVGSLGSPVFRYTQDNDIVSIQATNTQINGITTLSKLQIGDTTIVTSDTDKTILKNSETSENIHIDKLEANKFTLGNTVIRTRTDDTSLLTADNTDDNIRVDKLEVNKLVIGDATLTNSGNTMKINGSVGKTESIPIVTSITNNSDGSINWTYSNLHFENGIYVGMWLD